MGNLWNHRIYTDGDDGSSVFVAEYVSETTPESVRVDLALKSSRLQNYLQFQGVDVSDYVKKFPLEAEALLGGLRAKSICSRTLGLWLLLDAPPTKKVLKLPDKAELVSIEDGVRVWLIKTAAPFASRYQEFE
jgi:hypothetical protein